MRKPDFEKCTSLATELLAKQNFGDTLINIRMLKYDKSIHIDTIQNYCRITNTSLECFINSKTHALREGCTIIYDGVYIVLYNEKYQSIEHLNWTLAHEIGHVYLGHKRDEKIEEIEAHYFAAQLLMPEYTIFQMKNKYKGISSNDIYMLFNVSYPAAKKRLITINKKTFVQGGLKHTSIWNKQEKYIDFYFNYKNINQNYSPNDKVDLNMSYYCDYDYYNDRFNELELANALLANAK